MTTAQRAEKAVVLGAVPFQPGPLHWHHLREAGLLVAADGGALHAMALGLTPNVVVGDLDSVPAEALEALRQRGWPVQRYPTKKDKTDTHLAVEEARRRGAREVVLMGTWGGARPDHSIANLLLLGLETLRDLQLSLVEGATEVHLVRRELRLRGRVGDLCSLLPLSSVVRGVSVEGCAWLLREATLRIGDTRGVSNVLTSTEATVRVRAGRLLVAHYQPEMEG